MALLLFHLANLLLELVFWFSYPLLRMVLRQKNYLDALNPSAVNSRGGILFHAASVGEVNALRPLLIAIRESHPQREIILTVNTVTGLNVAKKLGFVAYLSVLDIPHLRSAQLKAISPRLICIAETELWLNLLYQAKRQKIDVVFVNARISEKSLKRYLNFKPLLKHLQSPIKALFCQSGEDMRRFARLFDVPLHDYGNLKYAISLPAYDTADLRRSFGFGGSDFIICLGSSRPGEEALLKSILPELRDLIPNLKLVIAIRHPKRSTEVRAIFPEAALFSDPSSYPGREVFVIDEIGHLNQFYALCDLALVGGSFYDFGGHNPLEPAFYAKAVIMGQFYRSCRDSVKQLQTYEAITISDRHNLKHDILQLYQDQNLRLTLGGNAKKCIQENSESLHKHIQGLKPWLI